MENKKPVLSLIIILIVGLFFISFFMKKKVDKTAEKVAQNPITKNLPTGVSIANSKTPEGLPLGFPDVPLNGKKRIENSYTLAYAGQNQDQKIIYFLSEKSIKENFNFYENWAKKNNWNILYKINNNNSATIIVEQNKRPLNINIVKDSSDPKISKVNMNW